MNNQEVKAAIEEHGEDITKAFIQVEASILLHPDSI